MTFKLREPQQKAIDDLAIEGFLKRLLKLSNATTLTALQGDLRKLREQSLTAFRQASDIENEIKGDIK